MLSKQQADGLMTWLFRRWSNTWRELATRWDSRLSTNSEAQHVRQQDDLNALNVLHVTGTKGKGSTCAFVDSILRHMKPEWKIGAFYLIYMHRPPLMLCALCRFVHLPTSRRSARANTDQRGSYIWRIVCKVLFRCLGPSRRKSTSLFLFQWGYIKILT